MIGECFRIHQLHEGTKSFVGNPYVAALYKQVSSTQACVLCVIRLLITDRLLNPSPEQFLLNLSFVIPTTNTSHSLWSTSLTVWTLNAPNLNQNLGFINANDFILLYWITFAKTHWFVLILNAIVLVMFKVKNMVSK